MVVVQSLEYTAVPYSIQPHNEDEALHGKPVLLTDCEIATLLKALPQIDVECESDDDMAVHLYVKLFKLWRGPNSPVG